MQADVLSLPEKQPFDAGLGRCITTPIRPRTDCARAFDGHDRPGMDPGRVVLEKPPMKTWITALFLSLPLAGLAQSADKMADDTKAAAKQTGHDAKTTTEKAADQTKDAAHKAGQSTKDAAHATKKNAQHAGQDMKAAGHDTGSAAKDMTK